VRSFGVCAELAGRLKRRRAVTQPETRVEEPVRDVARFVDLVDDVDAIVWEYQVGDGLFTYVSGAVERILGYPPQLWIDDAALSTSIRHPDDRARVDEFYARIEREGGRDQIESRVFAADRREVWLRELVHAGDGGGDRRVVRGVCVDITDRRRAELALAETEERYRSLIEQIPAVTYIWDAEGPGSENPRTYVSPQIESILGFPPHEWLIDPDLWRSRLHPDDAARVLAESARCVETGNPFRVEYRMLTHDGRIVWLRDEAHVVVHGGSGEPSLWQGVMFDVTERRRIETERHTLLARLVEAQEEERGRIASDVHDDSVQKMSAVGIRLEALRKRTTDPDARRSIDELHRAVRLSIARLRRLLFELRPPSLDRDGLATALREYLEQAGPEGGYTCSLHNGLHREPAGEVRTIAYRIAQEALTNVRKHAGARRVSVELEQRDDGFEVRIHDDGCGFAEPGAGTGRPGHRGLSTMHERASLAGGWLSIRSILRDDSSDVSFEAGTGDALPVGAGGGTSVEFWLPFDGRRGGLDGA
jgi:PAS domain S-box-containing protein